MVTGFFILDAIRKSLALFLIINNIKMNTFNTARLRRFTGLLTDTILGVVKWLVQACIEAESVENPDSLFNHSL